MREVCLEDAGDNHYQYGDNSADEDDYAPSFDTPRSFPIQFSFCVYVACLADLDFNFQVQDKFDQDPDLFDSCEELEGSWQNQDDYDECVVDFSYEKAVNGICHHGEHHQYVKAEERVRGLAFAALHYKRHKVVHCDSI